MKVKATRLRANLFKILDHVAESGETVQILRKGGVLKITPETRAAYAKAKAPCSRAAIESQL